MPLATKTKNFEPENVSWLKTDEGKTDDDQKFYKDYFKYKHSSKEGGGTIKGAATFKADFEITFPNGLYFEQGDKSKYKKLQGKAQLDMSNEKVRAFADSPRRGMKGGYVRIKDVEAAEFPSVRAKKEISYFEEASKENEKGKIPEGTVLNVVRKADDFYQVTFGGGEEGMLWKLRRGVARALYKNRKKIPNLKVESVEELEELIKFPIYFHTDDEGNETDRASWYLKITYKEGEDGWLASFNVPGVRELTLDEMMSHRITGKPCFKLQSLYRGGNNRSMQIFLSSLIVTDYSEIQYTSAQQEEEDELAKNAEFVSRMKGVIPEKPPPSSAKKSKKNAKKSKKKADSDDSDDDSDSGSVDVKKIVAPTLENVGGSDDDSDSDNEKIPGLPEKKDSDDEPPKEEKKKKKEKSSKKKDSDDEPPKEEKKKKKEKKAPPPESSDDEDDEPPKEEKNDSDDDSDTPPSPKKSKEKMKDSDDSDSD